MGRRSPVKPSPDWNDLLKNCDFEMTDEITDMLRIQQEAASKGEEAYYEPNFLAVLYPFLKNPSAQTAIPLLHVAPPFYSYFQGCSPGGNFYEMRWLLGKGGNFRPSSDYGSPDASEESGRQLRAAFQDSARPGAPAPTGWWLLPILGIAVSLILLGLNTTLGAICLALTSCFFGAGLIRAKRNRK
jgi:hypothetical protein